MVQHSGRSTAGRREIDVTETHISTLFFTPDRVFKLLKPVELGFVDHRGIEDRCRAASLEVELNSRLAPSVYLGTADVVEDGALTDRMIVMRRLPADRSVTHLLAHHELTSDHIREIARTMASFHSQLEPQPYDGRVVDAHRRRWTDNTDELSPYRGTVIDAAESDRVTELFSSWLDSNGDLLDRRVAEGHLRDGHGDLLADDIFCLDDGPQILDCLAFRDDLRLVDVLDDIAFLAMDLHRLGGSRLAQLLLAYYTEFSAEHHPAALAHYYVAYRAHVRCKIACLRSVQSSDEGAQLARTYHALCLDQLERARLRLVLVGGGPGSGKTTLARELGEQLGCAVLSSDDLRKDLAGVERTVHELASPDRGIYTPERSEATYRELIRRASLLLGSGESVILDASWTTEEHRSWAHELAVASGAELIPIECRIPDSVAKERIVRRLADPMSTSDATPEIVDYLSDKRAPWPDAIEVDGTNEFAEVLTHVLSALRRFGRTSDELEPVSSGTSFWGAALRHE